MLDLTAYELTQKIEAGEVSAREAAEAANKRVEEVEGEVNAFVTTTPELALERADRIDGRLRNGGIKPWEAVPHRRQGCSLYPGRADYVRLEDSGGLQAPL